MKSRAPTARDEALKQELIALIDRNSDVDPEDMLAIAAQLVGMLVAHQDQRKVNSAQVMEAVMRNIEEGNTRILVSIMNAKGTA